MVPRPSGAVLSRIRLLKPLKPLQHILAIESSCDETAVALVRRSPERAGGVVLEKLASQTAVHAAWGGVVPELAARAHLEALPMLFQHLLEDVQRRASEKRFPFRWPPDAVAATIGPGLMGGLLVGAGFGRALAQGWGVPFIGINHLEGHALSPRLTQRVDFPYLLVLLSGGHSQFVLVRRVGVYRTLGKTQDDSLGECFDKVARLLDLPYPGGPALEKLARLAPAGAPRFRFPVPQAFEPPAAARADARNSAYNTGTSLGCDFSFSGLKTAVARRVDAQRTKGHLDQNTKAALAYAFQTAVLKTLLAQTDRAIQRAELDLEEADLPPDRTPDRAPGGKSGEGSSRLSRCVLAGGVAANLVLQAGLEALCRRRGLTLFYPERAYCTDNAAMIGWAALERAEAGLIRPSPTTTRGAAGVPSTGEVRRWNEADTVDPRLPLDPLEPTRHEKLVEARRAVRQRHETTVSKNTR